MFIRGGVPNHTSLMDEANHRRAHARARLCIPARLVTFSDTRPCTVLDLSCTGAKIGASPPPRVGSMIVVENCPVELFGTVMWADRDSFGISFDSPMAQEQVIAMRRYADAEPEREREAQLVYARRWAQGARI